MGYRSDVKIITTSKGWKRLDKVVRKASSVSTNPNDDEYWLTDDNHKTLLFNGRYVLGEWDDIKWYTWDNEVAAFMKELDVLEKADIPFDFVRVGEEERDIEHRQYCSDKHWEKYSDMPSLEVRTEINVEY